MQVPLLDLRAQFESIRQETQSAVNAVLESQQFINGPAVKELEKAIAHYCDCEHAVGVSSGTDALLCSLMALDIGPGAEVITTPYTFFATAGSIWRVGAKPVFVDINPETFNLNPSQIENVMTKHTKAIMPVHLFGQCADMDPILKIAEKCNLAVIEDACQAIGATYRECKAGSMGTTGCFSFFPSKNLGGLGDGGMVTTQNAELANKLRAMRNHGGTRAYYHDFVGGNFRLDSLQTAGLLVKLPHLEKWSEKRRQNTRIYNQHFADMPEITTPVIRPENTSIYNQYVIRVPHRDALREHLKAKDIGHSVYYPLSLHQQPCFTALGYKPGDFPESERAAVETIALPVYPELTETMIDYVADEIKAFIASSGNP